MTIEIHQPELEALIQLRMASGKFPTIEDALLDALRSPSEPQLEPAQQASKISFTQFMMESPLWGSGLEIERVKDYPEPIDL
jgi:hypothetical protein